MDSHASVVRPLPPCLFRRLFMGRLGARHRYGTFSGFHGRRKKERTKELVVSAVLHGFRAIDTGELKRVHPQTWVLTTRPSLPAKTLRVSREWYTREPSELVCSEKLVGDALSELAKDHGIQRESLFIQTKSVDSFLCSNSY